MVRTLARGSTAEEPMATPIDPALSSKHAQKVRLAVYRTQMSKISQPYQVSYLIDISGYKDSRHSF